ncbi:MAG TPA: ABC transporter permease [bacterium]|nr:ABC transporter permease [bacterium]
MARPLSAVSSSISPASRLEAVKGVGQSFWGLAWQRFRHHKVALGGAAVVLVLVLITLLAGVIAPYRFEDIDLTARLRSPSWTHLLGTDTIGHDVFTRLLYAGRVSLLVGFSAATVATLVGIVVGATAGFYGGVVDNVLMRMTDVWLALPELPILIILSRYLGGSVGGIVFVISLFAWRGVARLVRGEVLKLKGQEFTDAARALGATDIRILVRHLVPNALAPVIVAATLIVGGAILTEAALSFLGIGIQPPVPSWGNMLQNAQDFILSAPRLAIYPGVMIFLTVLCFNFLGDGLRDALDPRLKL